MKIVTPSLIISSTEGFSQDILDRKSFGESLLNLIERSEDELVISLDGQWGEGKTTFVNMWQGLLEEKEIPNIYIDAFSNDYVDDAFISIASSITSYANNNTTKDNKEKIEEFKNTAKRVGVQLLSWSAKVGVKAATLGVIKDNDIEELKDIKNDLAKDASSIVSDFVGERLSSHKKDIEVIESFRNLLSELPNNLNKDESKPLIIIIDELDRCKPTYAVEVLEKIKHLFSVKNVVFVLVMHRTQLEEAIKSVYGQNIDAHSYLQKFINIETALPKRISDRYENDINKYCQKLYELHEMETWNDGRDLIDSLAILATHFNLSLRQLERVYTIIAVFYASSNENQLRLVPLLSFLAIIKVIHPSIFSDLLYQKISYEKLCNITGLTDEADEENKERKILFIMSWVKFAVLSDEEYEQIGEEDRIRGFGQALWKYNVDRERLLPIFIQRLSMFNVI